MQTNSLICPLLSPYLSRCPAAVRALTRMLPPSPPGLLMKPLLRTVTCGGRGRGVQVYNNKRDIKRDTKRDGQHGELWATGPAQGRQSAASASALSRFRHALLAGPPACRRLPGAGWQLLWLPGQAPSPKGTHRDAGGDRHVHRIGAIVKDRLRQSDTIRSGLWACGRLNALRAQPPWPATAAPLPQLAPVTV